MGKQTPRILGTRLVRGLSGRVFWRNFRLLVLLILLPLFLSSIIAYYCYTYASQREINDHGAHLAQSTAEQLSTHLTAQMDFAHGLFNMTDVQHFLIFPDPGGALSYKFRTIEEAIHVQMLQNDTVRDIAVYSVLNDTTICAEGLVNSNRFFDAAWMDGLEGHESGLSSWIITRTAIGKDLKPYRAVTVYCRLVHDNGLILGYTGISMDASKLCSALKLTLSDSDVAVYATDGSGCEIPIVGDPAGTEDCVLHTSAVPGTDWTVTAAVQRGGHSFLRSTLKTGLTVLVLCGALLTVFLAVLFYRQLMKPYNTVANLLSQPVEGAEEALLSPSGSVTDAVQKLLDQNVATSRELGNRAKDLRRMQSLALQAQINPHMLYNSLDSINWTVMELAGVENDASMMLTLLASVLRYAVDASTLTVSLFTELEHVQEYIVLQQLRYQHSFDFKLEADESVLQYNVIRLIVQPILENAIEHGIKLQKQRGLITLQVREENSIVRILIVDNGPGMDEARLEQVRSLIACDGGSTEKGKNIGMANVHRRIQLYYGDEYGLSIDSAPGCGTSVTIRFPKE